MDVLSRPADPRAMPKTTGLLPRRPHLSDERVLEHLAGVSLGAMNGQT